MLKASGSQNSTNGGFHNHYHTIELHLKKRQAQEMVRLAAKHKDDPWRQDFDRWMEGDKPVNRKTSILQLLFTRFRDLSSKLEFDQIEMNLRIAKN